MRRIVLPGFGSATTFTPERDSEISVFASGRRFTIKLKAHERTRIEFVNSLAAAA